MRDEEMVLKVSAKPGGTSLLELKSEFCGSGGLSNEQKEDLIEKGFTSLQLCERFMNAVQGALRLRLALRSSLKDSYTIQLST